MLQPLLSIQNLQVNFTSDGHSSVAVKDVNVEVQRGELVAIVGESGSGKSVTSLSILQLLPSPPADYKSGKILFTDKVNGDSNMLTAPAQRLRAIRGKEVAMIFQEPMSSLNPVHTCGAQVMEALLIHEKTSTQEAKKRTLELFERVKLPDPEGMLYRYPHQLSGGQKQRVMIAMAMSCNPSLLICDEPTTALDVTVQKTILGLIKELQQQLNIGVIFITHDLAVVAEIADRVVVMYKGAIVEQGPAVEIYNRPTHPYTKALLACRPILHPKGERLPVVSDFMEVESGKSKVESGELEEGSIKYEVAGTKDEVGSTKDQDVSTFNKASNKVGDSNYLTQSAQPNQPNQLNPTILKVENLSVWFEGRKKFFGKPAAVTKAVDDVSFEVYEGETLGLVGESGCGKTTLGRCILRLVEATKGHILYKGKDLTSASKRELRELRKDIQIIFQDPYSSLNPRITIGAAIQEPLKVHDIGANDKERKERVLALLEKVNLKGDFYNRYPHEFSGGQRQRLVIARALALNPSFVICDESVSALDVSVQAQVLNLLSDLKKEFGFTTIFISHDLSVVRYISDRIMVMNKGRIEEIGKANEVYYHPKCSYTQNLIASIPKGFPSLP